MTKYQIENCVETKLKELDAKYSKKNFGHFGGQGIDKNILEEMHEDAERTAQDLNYETKDVAWKGNDAAVKPNAAIDAEIKVRNARGGGGDNAKSRTQSPQRQLQHAVQADLRDWRTRHQQVAS